MENISIQSGSVNLEFVWVYFIQTYMFIGWKVITCIIIHVIVRKNVWNMFQKH